MANWLVSRERVKRGAGIHGADFDSRVDNDIEGRSVDVERDTRRLFIPRTETRLYRWPQPQGLGHLTLKLDQDLISVTTLQSEAQNSSPTTIAASDFFLEPVNTGPPYNRIEIVLSSSAAFQSGDTPQRSISVAGSWGYSNNTRSVGTVAGTEIASDATVTVFVVSDASLIDVGDTLLIESEQIFVSERAPAAEPNADELSGALASDRSIVTVGVDNGTRYNAQEVILVDSEKMLIVSISSNNLTVMRAVDGSVLASHANNAPVSVFRTLTIERGVNGTTAATHANSTAISKYEPVFDAQQLVLAESISQFEQERAGYGRNIGSDSASQELTGVGLRTLRTRTIALLKRARMATI